MKKRTKMLEVRNAEMIEQPSPAGFKTTFSYDVIERGDKVTDDELDRIREAIAKWARSNRVEVKVNKTRKGFEIVLYHAVPDGDTYGMSLFLHLSKGIFRELEKEKRK